MITVSILINGRPIFTRSAVCTRRVNDRQETLYKADDGSCVYHDPEDGAVPLAHKLLDLIHERP